MRVWDMTGIINQEPRRGNATKDDDASDSPDAGADAACDVALALGFFDTDQRGRERERELRKYIIRRRRCGGDHSQKQCTFSSQPSFLPFLPFPFRCRGRGVVFVWAFFALCKQTLIVVAKKRLSREGRKNVVIDLAFF